MTKTLLWFRRDLRLADNPALRSLLDENSTPIPVYIHDDHTDGCKPGAAEAWWLHHSLAALQESLRKRGSELLIFRGRPQTLLPELVRRCGAAGAVWQRCYEPAALARDEKISDILEQQHYSARVFDSGLLREPWQHLKRDGTPYRVFTPFWKALSGTGLTRLPLPAPKTLPAPDIAELPGRVTLQALDLLPTNGWDSGFHARWRPGEAGAWKALRQFLDTALPDYPDRRDIPGADATSRLSPHLHFGEIGPVQIQEAALSHSAGNRDHGVLRGTESFLRQLAWREFSYHTLYHFPSSATQPLDERFAAFPWRTDYREDLLRWQRGTTGIPLVDAGMRELWATGYMHNRVRMVVASFLTKNLMIPWQEGASWFQDTLVDADLANNTMGWQWTAGCGFDASPWFRVFNPVLQGEKFDPEGNYVRHWVPELAQLDRRYLHKPWSAPPGVLADAKVDLDRDYPLPMVDLRHSRQRAIEAWNRFKQNA
jgi:deoxyribodipyrimidine photo-lyase